MVLEKGEQERERGGGALINREVEQLQYIFEKVKGGRRIFAFLLNLSWPGSRLSCACPCLLILIFPNVEHHCKKKFCNLVKA